MQVTDSITDGVESTSCTGVIVGVFFSEFAFFLVTHVVLFMVTYYVMKKKME